MDVGVCGSERDGRGTGRKNRQENDKDLLIFCLK